MSVPVHHKLALSVSEAAEMLSVSEWTVRRLVKDGSLARVPHTSRTIISRAALDCFVNGVTVTNHLTFSPPAMAHAVAEMLRAEAKSGRT